VEQYPRIPAEEYPERIRRVREKMDEAGLEVGLAYATQHMPGDVQYLTGYDPHLENAAVLILPDDVIVLGGPEGERVFNDMASLGSWRNLSLFEIPFQDYGDLRFWSLKEVLREVAGGTPKTVGLLSAPNVLTQEIVALLRDATDSQASFRDASHILAQARYEKTPQELEMFRISSRIATKAAEAMLSVLAPGVRELEVAAEADRVIKQSGAYAYGFDTMVCTNERINTIIGRASNRVIREGDLVMLGASPRYEGYASTVGRTVVAGGATAEQAEFLDHGIEAYRRAAEKLREGHPAREVDLAAREYLSGVGLGDYHTYGVGHGIGLSECLEERTATRASDYLLPRGISMMIDVGLFGVPQFEGARHEDPFIISHSGEVEKLTYLPMNVYS
jgi:Xaa-Pro aminopeptidase